ncbi:MAG TPA: hypothetical protein VMU58_06930 [Gaiellaceae bacterium]|nr:hypothetical protein [Gaiellaceae bacterium]
MKKILALGAALVAAATLTTVAVAANPAPFPAPTVKQVFIAAQTVTTDGAMSSWFAPGSSVVFRAYAVDPKSHKVVDPKAVKYFYVTIPNQPNVKLAYGASAPGASTGLPWTGTWTVPASYPAGIVPFKVLIQLKQNGKQLKGQFVQMPVASAQLNISATAPAAFAPAVPAGPAGAGSGGNPLNLSLYVDTVNGTRPVGAAARPVGCSQTNVYKRGEQVVVRTWGTELATSDVLSSDNVSSAHFSIAGQPDVTLNYGAHGAVGNQVFFWASAWIVPATYPLGETTIHVVFNLESGKTGSYDYTINIIP